MIDLLLRSTRAGALAFGRDARGYCFGGPDPLTKRSSDLLGSRASRPPTIHHMIDSLLSYSRWRARLRAGRPRLLFWWSGSANKTFKRFAGTAGVPPANDPPHDGFAAKL